MTLVLERNASQRVGNPLLQIWAGKENSLCLDLCDTKPYLAAMQISNLLLYITEISYVYLRQL